MVIDHVAVYTSRLERLKNFYEKYFSARSNDKYHNPKTGLQTYFLTFGDGARFELMMQERRGADTSTGYIHLAFRVGSREAVDALSATLVDDGYRLKSDPRTTGDGYYESCVFDPDGNEVENVA